MTQDFNILYLPNITYLDKVMRLPLSVKIQPTLICIALQSDLQYKVVSMGIIHILLANEILIKPVAVVPTAPKMQWYQLYLIEDKPFL